MPDKTPARAELEAKQEEVVDRGKIDAIDAVGAIMVVADAMDIDPLQVIRDIKGGTRRFGEGSPEQVILDLIEISQSNFDMAVNDLEEFFSLESDIADLDD